MESVKDKVKDAISATLGDYKIDDCEKYPELMYDIADAVFDALGITVDEQDIVGAKVVIDKPIAVVCPKCEYGFMSDESAPEGR